MSHVNSMRSASPALMLAGLAGFLGVGASALAAHSEHGDLLLPASRLLLVHGAAFLGLAACLAVVQGSRILLHGVTLLWLLGLCLFCGDMASRAFLDERLFANAAPFGGSTLMLGWLLVLLSGVWLLVRRRA